MTNPPHGLGYDLDAINRIVAERKSAEALAAKAGPLNGHGTSQHVKPSGVDNIKSSTGGTSSEYLTARIARDRPDILERMKQGEFKSNELGACEAVGKRSHDVTISPHRLARD